MQAKHSYTIKNILMKQKRIKKQLTRMGRKLERMGGNAVYTCTKLPKNQLITRRSKKKNTAILLPMRSLENTFLLA